MLAERGRAVAAGRGPVMPLHSVFIRRLSGLGCLPQPVATIALGPIKGPVRTGQELIGVHAADEAGKADTCGDGIDAEQSPVFVLYRTADSLGNGNRHFRARAR